MTALAATGSLAGATVTVEKLQVQFGTRTVLKGVHLQLAPGERVAVVGESGGGKTTLLRVLAGLTEVTEGQVGVTQQHAAARVRVMFQEDRLLPWLSALDNAALGLPQHERHHAEAALANVGLAQRATAFPHQLSGGQRQRVALARALAHRPALLLLDEPFGALDAMTRAEMHTLLTRLLDETGATTVLVTHDLDEALKLADRVLLLRAGRVAEEVHVPGERPRNRRLLEPLRERLEAHLQASGPVSD
ncbi:ABC transporter ATP-binding protein (plasmid) [Deinococcus sp. KNUC1210]|uniref:ABC transporter ATP-binding protein n=1 Tax=Deinococcus sp. KNUC1210 TaxID=2917691 RepID=UPI001EF04FB0|nr:ABC transporter ATP-binding protein [Deinococcus sp. KNUC1210]ULH18116.1 ABC transporter ATP-binding protein [Deinococcus sp. KNUC1210]